MIPASKTAAPLFRPTSQARMIFHIGQQASGGWCVNSADGMVGGIFFERDAAIRFARRESVGIPVLVLIEPALPRGAIVDPFRGTMSRS
jgi:hypothetical protein